MKKPLAIAGTIAIIAIGTFVSASPASALITDGADPQSSGCSTGAYDVASWPAYDADGTYEANIELRYSPACGTNWVRVTQNDASYDMVAAISLDKPNGTFQTGDYARGVNAGYAYWWTGMLSAPGSTCVLVYASSGDNMQPRLNWTTKRVC